MLHLISHICTGTGSRVATYMPCISTCWCYRRKKELDLQNWNSVSKENSAFFHNVSISFSLVQAEWVGLCIRYSVFNQKNLHPSILSHGPYQKFHWEIRHANFLNKFLNFIYLFLALLGLCCCARAFSSCGECGPLFVAVRRLLIAVASLVVEHGL